MNLDIYRFIIRYYFNQIASYTIDTLIMNPNPNEQPFWYYNYDNYSKYFQRTHGYGIVDNYRHWCGEESRAVREDILKSSHRNMMGTPLHIIMQERRIIHKNKGFYKPNVAFKPQWQKRKTYKSSFFEHFANRFCAWCGLPLSKVPDQNECIEATSDINCHAGRCASLYNQYAQDQGQCFFCKVHCVQIHRGKYPPKISPTAELPAAAYKLSFNTFPYHTTEDWERMSMYVVEGYVYQAGEYQLNNDMVYRRCHKEECLAAYEDQMDKYWETKHEEDQDYQYAYEMAF